MSNPAVLALAAAAQQVAQPMIDWSPLIPALNGILAALASVLTAAVPFLAWYAVQWLRSHGVKMSAEAQEKLGEVLEKGAAKSFDYARIKATTYVDAEVRNLKIPVHDPLVADAANYMLAQLPDTLKKAGIDPSTPEGQASLVRFLTARLIPSPPAPTASLAVTVERVAEPALTDALRAAEGKP